MQTCDIHRGQSLNHWCLGCKQLICDVCIAAHNEMRFTRNHVIKDKIHIAYCTKHPQEYISHIEVTITSRLAKLLLLLLLIYLHTSILHYTNFYIINHICASSH